jgi:hypothetical protein
LATFSIKVSLRGALILLQIVAVSLGPALAAHHKLATFYNTATPVTLRGSVARVEWQNPHAMIYVTVMNPAGRTEEWIVEGSALAVLGGRGWARDTVKPGDVVTVSGFLPATQRTRWVGGATVELRDGRKLSFGGDLQRYR